MHGLLNVKLAQDDVTFTQKQRF